MGKRARDEMESTEPAPESAPERSLLDRLRNMWEFSNLMQYIFIFGKAMKIDEDLTIEDLENECIKSEPSLVLLEIGLALLKHVSSHRGLTPEIFDEYTRRQYVAKAPARNPFGTEEIPNKFSNFDVFTKLRVLVQLSQWTLINADRMRERMLETKDSEQIQWRVEEIGYDRQDRYYFVLDDNRLYRRTDPPPPAPPTKKLKSTSKKAKAAVRASRRRRNSEVEEMLNNPDGGTLGEDEDAQQHAADDGFGGRKWECIAITLEQYQGFLETIQRSRNEDEKALHRRIAADVLPIIEKAEESHLRKKHKQEREIMNLHKLASAKRSSRLEAKMERERQEQEMVESERKRKADLLAAKQDLEKQKKMDLARESRMMTREQRLKEREYKRILHEDELANLSAENKKLDAGKARMSERHLKAEMERQKKELAALAEDDEWFFDCSKCGVHGTNLDDGSHSVACEKCNVWQHSECLGISQEAAEKEDFHFVCRDCHRRAEDAKKPKIPSLKFYVGSSSSPPSQEPKVVVPVANEARKRKYSKDHSQLPRSKNFKPVDNHNISTPQPTRNTQNGHNGMHASVMNGPSLSPQGQLSHSIYSGNQDESFFSTKSYFKSVPPPSSVDSPSGPAAYINGCTDIGQQNGYVSQLPSQAFRTQSTTNGSDQGSQQPLHIGWSARYTPPQKDGPPPSQSPFANSSDRQRPTSSHNVPPPIINRPYLSPSQKSPEAFIHPQYQTPRINGTTSHPSSPPTRLPARSPVKQQSPPTTSNVQAPNSSPVAHQPPLHNLSASSPGFSPTKHSPHHPVPPGHGITGSPAVVPPVADLLPSPIQRSLDAAVKGLTPQQIKR